MGAFLGGISFVFVVFCFGLMCLFLWWLGKQLGCKHEFESVKLSRNYYTHRGHTIDHMMFCKHCGNSRIRVVDDPTS